MKKSVIVGAGHVVPPLGMAIWLYGYFLPGNPSLYPSARSYLVVDR